MNKHLAGQLNERALRETVAVIETPSGVVKNIHPDLLEFVEPIND